DVDIQSTFDPGGGYNVGWMAPGEWLNYTVNVGAAGTYTLDMRVSSNGSGGTFHVLVNGVNVTGAITVPNTGAWQTWTTLTKTGVSLSAGQQVVRVVLDTRGVTGSVCNLNWIRFTAATPPPPTVSASLTAPTSGATYTAPASIAVSANATTTS